MIYRVLKALKRGGRGIALYLLLLVSAMPAMADTSLNYSAWSKIESGKLIKMGLDYSGRQVIDSAMLCYTIVIDRYKSRQTEKTRQQAFEAMVGLWRENYYGSYNYSLSFNFLSEAKRIGRETDPLLPEVYMDFGIMYQTLGEELHDKSSCKKALDNYKQAFQLCKRTGNLAVIDVVMSNMTDMAYEMAQLGQIKKEWSWYSNLKRERTDTLFVYNQLMYHGFVYALQHDYDKALACFDEQGVLIANNNNLRYRLGTPLNKADIYYVMGKNDLAVKTILEAGRVAEENNVKDILLDVYSKLYKYSLGIPGGQANDYRVKYLELKDSLLSLQQLKSISQYPFVEELQKKSDEIQRASMAKQKLMVIVSLVTVFLLVVLILLFKLIKKNKVLNEKNLSLYNRLDDMLKAGNNDGKKDNDQRKKYEKSSLKDDEKTDLLARLKQVMDDNEVILQAGFSVSQLATILGTKEKYVSQIINEYYHCNFNSLVNTYRIQEACRRFKDQQTYGHLTIGAIGESVGFKARSSFISAFKAYTGMTPGDFLKIARNRG